MTEGKKSKTLNFFVVLGLFFGLCLFFYSQFMPTNYKLPITVVIKPGTSSKQIAYKLFDQKAIKNPSPFLFLYFIKRNPLIAGEYEFFGTMNAYEVLRKIQKGIVVNRKITIIEGWTVLQAVNALNEIEVLNGQITNLPEEGYLLPATYFYCHCDNRQELLDKMRQAMYKKLKAIWANRPADCQLKNYHELLTLASIVEKESSLKSERPRIARVFLNRLKKGMPLQADPTVLYAISLEEADIERLYQPLTKQDLKFDSPYNTYVYKGLPPGPIACPGEHSIRAAIRPHNNNEEFYFVADGEGGHNFSETLEKHNRNVSKWKKQLKDKKKQQDD